jgi:hypothetical protein
MNIVSKLTDRIAKFSAKPTAEDIKEAQETLPTCHLGVYPEGAGEKATTNIICLHPGISTKQLCNAADRWMEAEGRESGWSYHMDTEMDDCIHSIAYFDMLDGDDGANSQILRILDILLAKGPDIYGEQIKRLLDLADSPKIWLAKNFKVCAHMTPTATVDLRFEEGIGKGKRYTILHGKNYQNPVPPARSGLYLKPKDTIIVRKLDMMTLFSVMTLLGVEDAESVNRRSVWKLIHLLDTSKNLLSVFEELTGMAFSPDRQQQWGLEVRQYGALRTFAEETLPPLTADPCDVTTYYLDIAEYIRDSNLRHPKETKYERELQNTILAQYQEREANKKAEAEALELDTLANTTLVTITSGALRWAKGVYRCLVDDLQRLIGDGNTYRIVGTEVYGKVEETRIVPDEHGVAAEQFLTILTNPGGGIARFFQLYKLEGGVKATDLPESLYLDAEEPSTGMDRYYDVCEECGHVDEPPEITRVEITTTVWRYELVPLGEKDIVVIQSPQEVNSLSTIVTKNGIPL